MGFLYIFFADTASPLINFFMIQESSWTFCCISESIFASLPIRLYKYWSSLISWSPILEQFWGHKIFFITERRTPFPLLQLHRRSKALSNLVLETNNQPINSCKKSLISSFCLAHSNIWFKKWKNFLGSEYVSNTSLAYGNFWNL